MSELHDLTALEQGAAILGDEGEQQPIDHSKQCVIDIGDRGLTGGEIIPQGCVRRVGEEADAEGAKRVHNSVPQ